MQANEGKWKPATRSSSHQIHAPRPICALARGARMGELRPHQLTVLVARNEGLPWDFSGYGARTQEATLGIGGADYSLAGFTHVLRVERKSAEDYIGSISTGRERFQREMEHLRQFPFRICIVEHQSLTGLLDGLGRRGERAFRSRMSWQSAMGTTVQWSRRYCPVVFAGTRQDAQDYAWQFMFGVANDWWRTYQSILQAPEAAGVSA